MLHEFSINIPYESISMKIEQLNAHGIFNLYYEQPIEQVVIPNGYGVIEKEEAVVQLNIYFEEEINVEERKKELCEILSVENIQYQLIDNDSWQQPFPIVDLQNGWFIVPNSEKLEQDGKCIFIEPPRAFGTGLHSTTQDCLRFILAENFEGKKVLDLGTGSGILSIAASLVGAQKVIAIDIEDVETEVLYNAKLNNVEKSISVYQCDVLQPNFNMHEQYDWIFINIGGDESIQLCPFVQRHLKKNGKLLLSGMVEWNFQDTCSFFENNGFSILYHVQTDEWVTALLCRK